MLMTDDDCVPAPGWAAALTAAVGQGSVLAAGRTEFDATRPFVAASETIVRHAERRGPFVATRNLAVPRARSAVPLDERFREAGGEDREWGRRLAAQGTPVVHVDAARLRHDPQLDARRFWRQHVRYGRAARADPAVGAPKPGDRLARRRGLLARGASACSSWSLRQRRSGLCRPPTSCKSRRMRDGPPTHGVAVLGGGPAGLTAALVLARRGVEGRVLEADQQVGGIAKTVERRGSASTSAGTGSSRSSAPVQRLWEEALGDEFLVRPRLSRIYYRGEFFAYPLRAEDVVRRLGLVETLRCAASYVAARARRGRRPSRSRTG